MLVHFGCIKLLSIAMSCLSVDCIDMLNVAAATLSTTAPVLLLLILLSFGALLYFCHFFSSAVAYRWRRILYLSIVGLVLLKALELGYWIAKDLFLSSSVINKSCLNTGNGFHGIALFIIAVILFSLVRAGWIRLIHFKYSRHWPPILVAIAISLLLSFPINKYCPFLFGWETVFETNPGFAAFIGILSLAIVTLALCGFSYFLDIVRLYHPLDKQNHAPTQIKQQADTTWLTNDGPIKKAKDDLLGRSNMVERIVRELIGNFPMGIGIYPFVHHR